MSANKIDITEEMAATAKAMRAAGKTWGEVAAAIGTGRVTASRITDEYGTRLERAGNRLGNSKHIVTDEMVATIREMRAARKPWDVVAGSLGVNRDVVRNIASRHCPDACEPMSRGTDREAVATMADDGMTMEAIAAFLGVERETIRHIALKDGLVFSNRHVVQHMPAGHQTSWAAITAGTSMAGSPYPLPVQGYANAT